MNQKAAGSGRHDGVTTARVSTVYFFTLHLSLKKQTEKLHFYNTEVLLCCSEIIFRDRGAARHRKMTLRYQFVRIYSLSRTRQLR
jgi:hypothetical protein